MTREEFIAFMNKNFELGSISNNLLSAMWYESHEKENGEKKFSLYRMLYSAFGSDLLDEEYIMICNIEKTDLFD